MRWLSQQRVALLLGLKGMNIRYVPELSELGERTEGLRQLHSYYIFEDLVVCRPLLKWFKPGQVCMKILIHYEIDNRASTTYLLPW